MDISKMTRKEFMEKFEYQCVKDFNCILKDKYICNEDCTEHRTIVADNLQFKDDLEVKKVEYKTIKVRCINTLSFKDLTIDKEYSVIKEESQGYKIINDDESMRRYHKSLFEKVEDVLMVECINKNCGDNNNGKCISKVYTIDCSRCVDRITKTPNYAEEQLEYAKDKENRCYNKTCETRHNNICANDNGLGVCIQQIKEPINYEEEHNKLKKENESLKQKDLEQQNYIGLLEKRYKEDAERIEIQKSTIIDLKNKIENLENIYNSKQNQWENEQVERVKDLEKVIAELKKQSNQGYMEQMNITINEKNEEIERLSKLTNEYYYNWVEEQKKNKIMESDLIKYESTIKNQKEVIKTLASLL